MIEPAIATSSGGSPQRRMQAALLRYLPLLLLALAWEVGARSGLVSTLALPSLSTVVAAWIDLLKDGELVSNGAASLWRTGAGLALAIVIGAALALSFILLVSSELIAAREGLGYLIGFLGASGTYDAMFAVVLTVALLGFIADRIYLVLMQRMLRWRE